MGEFMAKHTHLAKSMLPSTSQGKARANRLWEQLAAKLNASGPPLKDAKMWRKVYADQKQMVKKRLPSTNPQKKKTGGGPYEEKVLSFAEEQILAAAGIEVAVEGLKTVQSFGSVQKGSSQTKGASRENSLSPCALVDTNVVVSEIYSSLIDSDPNVEDENTQATKENTRELPKTNQRGKESKTSLLQKNISSTEAYHREVLQKFDTLIELNKRNLELKERDVKIASELLEIKKKALELIKSKMCSIHTPYNCSKPETTTEAPVITTKPLDTMTPKLPDSTISPTKLKPTTVKPVTEKTSIITSTTVKSKEPEPKAPEVVTSSPVSSILKAKNQPKSNAVKQSSQTITSSSSTHSLHASSEAASSSPSVVFIDNFVHDPEYDLLSRQPPQYVEENYRVVSLKPSHKNSRSAVVVTPEKNTATSSVLATRAPLSSSRHHKNKKHKIRASSTLQVLKTAAPLQQQPKSSPTTKPASHRSSSSTRKSSKKGSSHRSAITTTTHHPHEDVVIVKSTTSRNKPKRKNKNKGSTTAKPRYHHATTTTTTTEASVKRAFKPKPQASNSDLDGNNNIHITKLNRAPGRWQYKTSPKPRVAIRKPSVEVNGPLGLANVSSSSPSINVYPEPIDFTENINNNDFLNQNVIYNQTDLEFEGSQNGAVLNNIDQEGKQKFFTETINVEISTPVDFKDTYYEIATIKKPFIFQAGVLKKTRYITVTSTIEKFLTAESTAEPRNENEPLTENILATTERPSGNGMLVGSITTLPPIYVNSESQTPYLETVTESFSVVNQKLKTQVLPVINEVENETVYHTLVQTIDITSLITITKTLSPDMETKHFNGFQDFVGNLDEAGSEINLDLEFGDEGNHEASSSSESNKNGDLESLGGLRNNKTTTAAANTILPTLSSDIPPPQLLPTLPNVITNSRPVVKLETLWESYVVPITNGLSTSYRTLSKAKGVVEKTEYVVDTTTVPPQILPPSTLNPFLLPLQQQQFQTITTPIVQQTIVTQTESKVLKLTFGAKTAYTTLYSTQVVPTLQTMYVTTSVAVQPTANPFPGFYPPAYNPFAYLG